MENHQPKADQMPWLKMELEQFGAFESQNEYPQQDSLDQQLFRLISDSIPPFVVTENYKIRREQLSPEPQSQAECFNIQDKILSYNRKDKSLMELTRKFIEKFEGASSKMLVLDKVTVELNVQRRRIYDIINIMESLAVVSKTKKNVYEWKGLKKAVETIQNLSKKDRALDEERCRKQKSLQSLATLFLQLFTQNKQGLTLEEAAHNILSQIDEKAKKTKIRRLYDIVNVFKCLGLVQKIKSSKNLGGKPIYRWLGCDSLVKIIQQKTQSNNICSMQAEDSSTSDMSHQIKKEQFQYMKIICSLNETIQGKNPVLDSLSYCSGLRDISNFDNQTSFKKTRKNSENIQKKQQKQNSQLRKCISLVQSKRKISIQNSLAPQKHEKIVNQLKLPQQNSYKSKHQDLIKMNLNMEQLCQGSCSLFQNLIRQMNNYGAKTIEEIQSKFEQIIWPS